MSLMRCLLRTKAGTFILKQDEYRVLNNVTMILFAAYFQDIRDYYLNDS